MLARHRNGRRPVNVLQCDVLAAGAITLLVRAVLIEEFRHRALGGRLSVRHGVDVQFCGAILLDIQASFLFKGPIHSRHESCNNFDCFRRHIVAVLRYRL